MDKIILNGNKLRLYNQGNSQSGSIQYTDSKLSIGGNSAGSGVLFTDGKLYLKSGNTTTSIIYNSSSTGVTLKDGILHFGSGADTGSILYSNSILKLNKPLEINYSGQVALQLVSSALQLLQFLIISQDPRAGYGGNSIGSYAADVSVTGAGNVTWGKYGAFDTDWGRYIQQDSSGNTLFGHGTISVPSTIDTNYINVNYINNCRSINVITNSNYSSLTRFQNHTNSFIIQAEPNYWMDSLELFKIWTLPPDPQNQGEEFQSYINIGAESSDYKPVHITIGHFASGNNTTTLNSYYTYISGRLVVYNHPASITTLTSSIGISSSTLRLGTLASTAGDFLTINNGLVASRTAALTLTDIGAAPLTGVSSSFVPLGRTINISSANTNITATGGGDLSANRTLQVTMSAVPSFTGVTASTGFTGSGYVRVGGDIRGTQITASVGVSTPTILVTSVTTASNLSVGNSTKVNNYPVVGMASGSLLVYNGTNITASVHTGDDFYGSWMSHAQCLARISLRI